MNACLLPLLTDLGWGAAVGAAAIVVVVVAAGAAAAPKGVEAANAILGSLVG